MLSRLMVGAFIMAVGANSAGAEARGKFAAIKGQVFVQPAGGSESRAQANASLASGTRIRTGADGEATVAFEDGSQLRMTPNSSLELSGNKRQEKKKNAIVLFFGRIRSKVAKAAGKYTSYEVNTANAVCGVRGTEFETAVGDDGSVRVRVTAGSVGVNNGHDNEQVDAGEQADADENRVEEPQDAEERVKWEAWQKDKRERLRTQGHAIVDKVKGKIMSRKEHLEALRAREKDIEAKRKGAEERLKKGDANAANEIRGYNRDLAVIADEMADLGDSADSEFGLVDHFADLAGDPRFNMIDRKYLEAEAASLRRVKATLDALVHEGTDMSVESMNKMLDDMGKGKGTIKDNSGSSAKDLFGPDKQQEDEMKP